MEAGILGEVLLEEKDKEGVAGEIKRAKTGLRRSPNIYRRSRRGRGAEKQASKEGVGKRVLWTGKGFKQRRVVRQVK